MEFTKNLLIIVEATQNREELNYKLLQMDRFIDHLSSSRGTVFRMSEGIKNVVKDFMILPIIVVDSSLDMITKEIVKLDLLMNVEANDPDIPLPRVWKEYFSKGLGMILHVPNKEEIYYLKMIRDIGYAVDIQFHFIRSKLDSMRSKLDSMRVKKSQKYNENLTLVKKMKELEVKVKNQTIELSKFQVKNVRQDLNFIYQKEAIENVKEGNAQELKNVKQELENVKQANVKQAQELENVKQANVKQAQELKNVKQANVKQAQELKNVKQELENVKKAKVQQAQELENVKKANVQQAQELENVKKANVQQAKEIMSLKEAMNQNFSKQQDLLKAMVEDRKNYQNTLLQQNRRHELTMKMIENHVMKMIEQKMSQRQVLLVKIERLLLQVQKRQQQARSQQLQLKHLTNLMTLLVKKRRKWEAKEKKLKKNKTSENNPKPLLPKYSISS